MDALRTEYVQGEKVQGWAPSLVVEADADSVCCEPEAFVESARERFDRKGNKLAPYGFRSGDWSWRDKISAGERLDIFDTQGVWFLGTVLDVKETEVKGKKVKEYYVGYRIYLSEGTKMDSKGRAYEGWSEQYDAWIPAYSLRLQK